MEVFPYGAVCGGDVVAAGDGGEEVIGERMLGKRFGDGDLFEELGVGEDDLRGGDGPEVQIEDAGEVVAARDFGEVGLGMVVGWEEGGYGAHDGEMAPYEGMWRAGLRMSC